MKKISFLQKIKKKNFIQKIDFVFLFFFLVASYLIYNLYILQIIKGKYYNDIILSQNSGQNSSEIFYRGDIFFQNKDNQKILAATQKNGWILAINPKVLKNEKTVFKKINKIIAIDEKKFLEKAAKKNDPYEEIKRKIDLEKAKKIKKLKIKGILLVKENWRHYPFNDLAAKVLGFLNIDNEGVYGLEKTYEDILKRDKNKKDRNIFFTLFADKKTDELFTHKNISKEGNLISSLNLEVQKYTESILKKIDKKYHSQYSAAIVMKADTGEIIAMADTKNFDLNQKKQDYRNEFVEYIFEVGSIFKPLVVAIGLDTKAINQNFSYHDYGCVNIQEYKVCNYDKKARGKNTGLYQIIAQSLNLGMINIGNKIGKKKMLDYFINLGLAEETGIDLPGEVPSNISSLNYEIDINYATASFGQGIAFTPIGILRALNTLSNDGFLIEPHLIKEIDYGDLIPTQDFITEKKQIFSPSTIKIIKDILVQRSKKSTLETKYRRVGYTAATKTGTAQIPDKNGGYTKNIKNHFFFGFFPAYAQPSERYSILLFTIKPQGVKYSSQTLSEPFYELMNFIIAEENILPDEYRKEH